MSKKTFNFEKLSRLVGFKNTNTNHRPTDSTDSGVAGFRFGRRSFAVTLMSSRLRSYDGLHQPLGEEV